MTSGNWSVREGYCVSSNPDGSWDLPDGLIDRIECCGLMVTVGHWVLEESCRLLAASARARHYAALVGKPLRCN
ncbi:hypothetical protein ACVXHB_05940 [Escherichia coli]